jgi:hypothetical protein
MNGEFNNIPKIIFLLLSLLLVPVTNAQDLTLNANADFVSRYIWRGLNVNDQPNIQPSINLNYSGLQLGFWGSYGLTHQNSSDEYYSVSQEIDTWLSYSFDLSNGMGVSILFTDYYFPNGGIKIGNFNNYDNPDGPGAHTLEAGLNLTGPESFPVTLSTYVNIYNDKGNNIYLQADYSINVSDVGLGFFVGAALGSEDNPAYYGTDKFNVINMGINASKEIRITEDFSLPVFCSYILNPQAEISYLIFGISF